MNPPFENIYESLIKVFPYENEHPVISIVQLSIFIAFELIADEIFVKVDPLISTVSEVIKKQEADLYCDVEV